MRTVTMFKNGDYDHKKMDWSMIKIGTGKFHKWGISYEECEFGTGQFTTAIIEMEDGSIKNWPADMVKFEDGLPI